MSTKEKTPKSNIKKVVKKRMTKWKPTLKCGKNIGNMDNGGEVRVIKIEYGSTRQEAYALAYEFAENEARTLLIPWINSQRAPLICHLKKATVEEHRGNANSARYRTVPGIDRESLQECTLNMSFRAIINCTNKHEVDN